MDLIYKIAVLIDGDNVSFKYAKTIFDELNKNYGDTIYRRIYGDWSKSTGGWDSSSLIENGITPIHQIAYSTGKNSTDITMVIDAMDILYQNKVNAFCIVTSDSDFTRLILRLRESDKFTIVMGESKTPIALQKACNKFIYLNLVEEENTDNHIDEHIQPIKNENCLSTSFAQITNEILSIVSEKEDVCLGEIGSYLSRKYSDFDVRNYGFSKLSTLVEQIKGIKTNKINSTIHITRSKQISIPSIEKEIKEIIENKGKKGIVNNLSVIHSELITKHGSHYLKDLGFSKPSSFIKTLKSVKLTNNTITLVK